MKIINYTLTILFILISLRFDVWALAPRHNPELLAKFLSIETVSVSSSSGENKSGEKRVYEKAKTEMSERVQQKVHQILRHAGPLWANVPVQDKLNDLTFFLKRAEPGINRNPYGYSSSVEPEVFEYFVEQITPILGEVIKQTMDRYVDALVSSSTQEDEFYDNNYERYALTLALRPLKGFPNSLIDVLHRFEKILESNDSQSSLAFKSYVSQIRYLLICQKLISLSYVDDVLLPGQFVQLKELAQDDYLSMKDMLESINQEFLKEMRMELFLLFWAIYFSNQNQSSVHWDTMAGSFDLRVYLDMDNWLAQLLQDKFRQQFSKRSYDFLMNQLRAFISFRYKYPQFFKTWIESYEWLTPIGGSYDLNALSQEFDQALGRFEGVLRQDPVINFAIDALQKSKGKLTQVRNKGFRETSLYQNMVSSMTGADIEEQMEEQWNLFVDQQVDELENKREELKRLLGLTQELMKSIPLPRDDQNLEPMDTSHLQVAVTVSKITKIGDMTRLLANQQNRNHDHMKEGHWPIEKLREGLNSSFAFFVMKQLHDLPQARVEAKPRKISRPVRFFGEGLLSAPNPILRGSYSAEAYKLSISNLTLEESVDAEEQEGPLPSMKVSFLPLEENQDKQDVQELWLKGKEPFKMTPLALPSEYEKFAFEDGFANVMKNIVKDIFAQKSTYLELSKQLLSETKVFLVENAPFLYRYQPYQRVLYINQSALDVLKEDPPCMMWILQPTKAEKLEGLVRFIAISQVLTVRDMGYPSYELTFDDFKGHFNEVLEVYRHYYPLQYLRTLPHIFQELQGRVF